MRTKIYNDYVANKLADKKNNCIEQNSEQNPEQWYDDLTDIQSEVKRLFCHYFCSGHTKSENIANSTKLVTVIEILKSISTED